MNNVSKIAFRPGFSQKKPMARALRIEYPGAIYHVICRGNNRQTIYRDDQDRKRYFVPDKVSGFGICVSR